VTRNKKLLQGIIGFGRAILADTPPPPPPPPELKGASFAPEREFAWEFAQVSYPGQTRTRVAWELMGVGKREFAWEFSQVSCPGQARTGVAWELMRDYAARVTKPLIKIWTSSQLTKVHESTRFYHTLLTVQQYAFMATTRRLISSKNNKSKAVEAESRMRWNESDKKN
jgi:hypothetical protein